MRGHSTLGLLLLTLTACSANVSSPGEVDADAVTQTTAVVTFERITQSDVRESRDVTRGATAARFVQTRTSTSSNSSTGSTGSNGVDERALKLVGAAFEAPPSFGCVALSDEVDAASGRALELADVGGLQVAQTWPGNATAHVFPLVPRQVPDPVGLVGGVLYYAPYAPSSVADGQLSSQVIPGSRYSVRAAGSPSVPSFELSGTAPFEVLDVRVAGQPSGARATLSPQSATVDSSWSTPDAARETGDVFFVDVVVQRANGTNGSTLRCAADAVGASIPSAAFGSGQDEGAFSVHRVHRDREPRARANAGAARSPLESSELRFDFSRVVAFSRR